MLCGQWTAGNGTVKLHWRRMHTTLWSSLREKAHQLVKHADRLKGDPVAPKCHTCECVLPVNKLQHRLRCAAAFQAAAVQTLLTLRSPATPTRACLDDAERVRPADGEHLGWSDGLGLCRAHVTAPSSLRTTTVLPWTARPTIRNRRDYREMDAEMAWMQETAWLQETPPFPRQQDNDLLSMVRLTAKVTISHEDSLNMTKADRGFVLFIYSGQTSLPPALRTMSKNWHDNQGVVDGQWTPLRVVLLRCIFHELQTLYRFFRRSGQEGRGLPERTPEARHVADVEVVPGKAGYDSGRASRQHEHGGHCANPGEHHGRPEATASRATFPEPTGAHRAASRRKGGHGVGAEPMGASPPHQLPEAVRAHRAHACGDSGKAGGHAMQPGRAGTTEDGLRQAGQETLSCHQATVAAPGEAQHLAGYSDASLLARPLENPNNLCYANNTIVSFLWIAPIGRHCLHSPIPRLSLTRVLHEHLVQWPTCAHAA